jgi:hypothetical protein
MAAKPDTHGASPSMFGPVSRHSRKTDSPFPVRAVWNNFVPGFYATFWLQLGFNPNYGLRIAIKELKTEFAITN